MQYAISVPNFGEFADVRAVAALAREAEGAGWDGFFMWDHILLDREMRVPMADPWVTLTAVAVATRRVRIGTMVTPIARRRPWKLARETVTLDRLSAGRLILGVGLGFPPDAEFAAFGEDPDGRARAQKLDEGLDVLTGLWSGEPFSYRGKHYRVDGPAFLPRPAQSPRIPIWAACMWPNRAPLRRAARWDGVVALKEATETGIDMLKPDDLRDIVAIVRSGRADGAPFDVAMGGPLFGDRARRAEQLVPYIDAGLTWWLEGTGGEPGSFDDLRARVLAGPPHA